MASLVTLPMGGPLIDAVRVRWNWCSAVYSVCAEDHVLVGKKNGHSQTQ